MPRLSYRNKGATAGRLGRRGFHNSAVPRGWLRVPTLVTVKHSKGTLPCSVSLAKALIDLFLATAMTLMLPLWKNGLVEAWGTFLYGRI